MLPDIKTEDRGKPLRNGTILVGGRDNLEVARFTHHQPHPTTAKVSNASRLKSSLKLFESMQLTSDSSCQLPRRNRARTWGDDCPKESVVNMSPTIILNNCADLIGDNRETRNKPLDRLTLQRWISFQRFV